jgi:hypothetical protein
MRSDEARTEVLRGLRAVRAPHNSGAVEARCRAGRDAAAAGSARPDERVAALDLDEVGEDRSREGRVVELHRVIDGVVFRGPLPGGADLDRAGEDAQGRGLLVRRRLGRDEAGFDVEREGADGAAEGAVFAAGEAADLLDCCFRTAPIAA